MGTQSSRLAMRFAFNAYDGAHYKTNQNPDQPDCQVISAVARISLNSPSQMIF
jgi:hypothetical protein